MFYVISSSLQKSNKLTMNALHFEVIAIVRTPNCLDFHKTQNIQEFRVRFTKYLLSPHLTCQKMYAMPPFILFHWLRIWPATPCFTK